MSYYFSFTMALIEEFKFPSKFVDYIIYYILLLFLLITYYNINYKLQSYMKASVTIYYI